MNFGVPWRTHFELFTMNLLDDIVQNRIAVMARLKKKCRRFYVDPLIYL